jgi:hypothetical protein
MGWENHRNSKPDSKVERASLWLNGQIDAGGINKRHADNAKASREAAKKMNPAPGGKTRSHKPLSWKDKRAADKILKEGRKK